MRKSCRKKNTIVDWSLELSEPWHVGTNGSSDFERNTHAKDQNEDG